MLKIVDYTQLYIIDKEINKMSHTAIFSGIEILSVYKYGSKVDQQ